MPPKRINELFSLCQTVHFLKLNTLLLLQAPFFKNIFFILTQEQFIKLFLEREEKREKH